MNFGQRLRERREELKITRAGLAECLGVKASAIANYENGFSFPREEILLRLFDCLQTDPNTLLRDSFQGGSETLTGEERILLENYRALSPQVRESVINLIKSIKSIQNNQHPV